MSEVWLSPGVFARQSRLSAKALRLYASKGILTPAQTDAYNGYRRYNILQLQDARLIRLLRQSGMPLPVVAKILAAPRSDRSGLIAEYATDAEAELQRQHQLLSLLSRTFTGGKDTYPMHEINRRTVPEQTILTEQAYVKATELSAWIATTGMRQLDLAAKVGGQIGPSMVIYHGEVTDDSDGPVESCIPVRPNAADPAKLPVRVEPAHTEVFTTVTRAQVRYPDILSAYDALNEWIERNHAGITGPPRELYFASPSEGPDDETVADIAIPIADNDKDQ